MLLSPIRCPCCKQFAVRAWAQLLECKWREELRSSHRLKRCSQHFTLFKFSLSLFLCICTPKQLLCSVNDSVPCSPRLLRKPAGNWGKCCFFIITSTSWCQTLVRMTADLCKYPHGEVMEFFLKCKAQQRGSVGNVVIAASSSSMSWGQQSCWLQSSFLLFKAFYVISLTLHNSTCPFATFFKNRIKISNHYSFF